MTNDEALQEANRLWGQNGHVRHDHGPATDTFLVGIRYAAIFHVKGLGQSWEEAFKDAIKKRTPWPPVLQAPGDLGPAKNAAR